MDEDVLICPECNAEYFAHVTECNDCAVPLVRPGDVGGGAAELDEAGQGRAGPSGFVVIERGSLSSITELAGVLGAAGIEHDVVQEKQARGCASSGRFSLMVPGALTDPALGCIEEYWNALHPEVKEARERLDRGLCPCCGSYIGGMETCRECGLVLEVPGEEGDEGGG